jgi:transketolase
MRPRFLINILENAISNGINRGHEKVDEEDCLDAVRQHSLYLIDDFGYEIRDVSGLTADLLYSLVGTEPRLQHQSFLIKFIEFGLSEQEAKSAFQLMLWYGVIGIVNLQGTERFIYDYEYNIKRLEAEARLIGVEGFYVTNAALHIALAS